MNNVKVSLAISEYDHVRDLTSGLVRPEGIDLTPLIFEVEEIFFRFTPFREWDVSEMSFGKYVSLIADGDETLTAIPVFPSRIFRQSSIYVRRDSGLKDPKDLAGRKVGIPEWAQTAGIYTRGWLQNTVGLPLREISWCQAGVNQPGRVEKVKIDLPKGVKYQSYPDKCLSEMLVDGDVDAVMTAHPPQCFKDGDANIGRLFEDYRPVEEAYWKETGIFPIMHVIAIRQAVLDQFPWVAMNLFKAFEEAKRRSIVRAGEITASRFPIPWCFHDAKKAEAYFDGDYWPYGIDDNRVTLEAFLGFAHEQGVCRRLLKPEELFAEQVQGCFKV